MHRGLEPDEREKLLTTIRQAIAEKKGNQQITWIRDYLAILLGLEAGLRSSEAARLLISHVWWNGEPRATTIIEAMFNKCCKEGIIPLSANIRNTLRVYMPHRLSWLPPGKEDDWLLSNKPGKRKWTGSFCPATMHKIVHFWARKAGIRPFRFHDLRHTFATTAMAVDNSNLKMVQDLMRHRSMSSTQVYLHPTASQLRIVIDNAFPGATENPL